MEYGTVAQAAPASIMRRFTVRIVAHTGIMSAKITRASLSVGAWLADRFMIVPSQWVSIQYTGTQGTVSDFNRYSSRGTLVNLKV